MDHQKHVDALLERYLSLLDEYTTLRKSLSDIQAKVYQDIARANFAGERGRRYGQDQYDERMRALRVVAVRGDDPVWSVRRAGLDDEEDKDSGQDGEKTESRDEEGKTQRHTSVDPLRWFGLLAPAALRSAQSNSVRAVEDVIPRLVSVDAQMAALEIEVRRARKRRAKMERDAETI